MKGDRPTDDPAWRHVHAGTGRTGHCARKGCPATWPVLCHGHTRRHCDPCREGIARNQDRERKRAQRLNERIRAEDQLDEFGRVLITAREAARKRLSGEWSREDLAEYVRVHQEDQGDWDGEWEDHEEIG